MRLVRLCKQGLPYLLSENVLLFVFFSFLVLANQIYFFADYLMYSLNNLVTFLSTHCSLLVIAQSSNPPIIVVDITSYETREARFDGSAQDLSVDQDNEVVYWANFGSSAETRNLMRSYYTGQTEALNISYDGEIDLAQGYMHLYVLDKENNRIDKYNKETWKKIDTFYTEDEPKELLIAFGESSAFD